MGIKGKLTKAVGNSTITLKKNSPHIMFGVGLAGVVTSTVLACRATLRANVELDDIRHELDMVKNNNGEPADTKDVAYVYIKSAGRLVGTYAPALIVGGVSVALLTGSHVQLTRRNTALTVAYAGLHRAYMEYRDRVREEIGEEKERDLYFGAVTEKGKDDNGKIVDIKTIDPNKLSEYARIFDETSPNWNKNAEYNRLFIQCQQNYANNLLIARGHLFLNEVYDMLGLERSQAGQVVGWVLNNDGDNYVDFGLFNASSSYFVNGYEPSIVLDFNVDGVIFDKF